MNAALLASYGIFRAPARSAPTGDPYPPMRERNAEEFRAQYGQSPNQAFVEWNHRQSSGGQNIGTVAMRTSRPISGQLHLVQTAHGGPASHGILDLVITPLSILTGGGGSGGALLRPPPIEIGAPLVAGSGPHWNGPDFTFSLPTGAWEYTITGSDGAIRGRFIVRDDQTTVTQVGQPTYAGAPAYVQMGQPVYGAAPAYGSAYGAPRALAAMPYPMPSGPIVNVTGTPTPMTPLPGGSLPLPPLPSRAPYRPPTGPAGPDSSTPTPDRDTDYASLFKGVLIGAVLGGAAAGTAGYVAWNMTPMQRATLKQQIGAKADATKRVGGKLVRGAREVAKGAHEGYKRARSAG